ncbi:MAG: TlpA family protein disulfide reductase [Blastocatellia bacterium]
MTLKHMFDSVRTLKPDAASSKKRDLVFLIILLAASLSLNVVLGWKVTRHNHSFEAENQLVEGMPVPPITVSSVSDDRQVAISYGNTDKPTVLYILTPSCQWCTRNLKNINTLANLRGDSYHFVAVSLTDVGLKEYLDANKLGFPVYRNIPPEKARQLGLGSTPQTIIVSPKGRVLKNWVGAYGEALQPEVEKYFNVSLPGLTSN